MTDQEAARAIVDVIYQQQYGHSPLPGDKSDTDFMVEAIADALAAEREACVKVVFDYEYERYHASDIHGVADAIRTRRR